MGATRIDAVAAYERLIRAAQAGQAAQISALTIERQALLGVGSAADLSIIGEVAMARNVSLSAASAQYELAMGLAALPLVADVFAAGGVSEYTAKSIVREAANLTDHDLTKLDALLAPRISGLSYRKATDMVRRMVIRLDADAARQRVEKKRADQRVDMFPDGDGVATLCVRGPAEQITAAYQALEAWAHGLHSTEPPRRVRRPDFLAQPVGVSSFLAA